MSLNPHLFIWTQFCFSVPEIILKGFQETVPAFINRPEFQSPTHPDSHICLWIQRLLLTTLASSLRLVWNHNVKFMPQLLFWLTELEVDRGYSVEKFWFPTPFFMLQGHWLVILHWIWLASFPNDNGSCSECLF